MEEQSHPQYSKDREVLNKLLSKNNPKEGDLVDLARLNIRYQSFPGAFDIQSDIKKILKFWKLNIDSLNESVKEIWSNGYKPGNSFDEK